MKKFARIDHFLERHIRTIQHQRIKLCPEKRPGMTLGHSNVGKTEMTINIRDGQMWNLVTLRLLRNYKHLYRYQIGNREHKERRERERELLVIRAWEFLTWKLRSDISDDTIVTAAYRSTTQISVRYSVRVEKKCVQSGEWN